jgi:hypothetical protein
MSEGKKSTAPIGQPLAVDYAAASTSSIEPGFVAKPPGAPVYHGFQILSGVTADGFTFGKITDFETAPCDYGPACLTSFGEGFPFRIRGRLRVASLNVPGLSPLRVFYPRLAANPAS